MKRVLITGGNRGLGLALATQLLAEGNRVFVTCRATADQTALQALVGRYGEALSILPLDVQKTAGMAEVVSAVLAHTNALDWLINNAGVMSNDSLATVQEADLHQAFAINAIAPLLLTQALLPLLQEGTNPLVLNISSSFGSIGRKQAGMPLRYSYSMSKAALNMFTKTAANELRPLGIAVFAVHPGWVQTDMGGPSARLTPTEAAQTLLHTVNQLTLAESGHYLTENGQPIEW